MKIYGFCQILPNPNSLKLISAVSLATRLISSSKSSYFPHFSKSGTMRFLCLSFPPPPFPRAVGPSELLNQVWWFSILVGCQVEARMSLINNLSSTHWQEVGNSSSDGRQIVDDKKKNKHTNRKRPRCHNFSPFFLTIQRSGFFLTRRLLRRISRLLVNQIIACLKRDF